MVLCDIGNTTFHFKIGKKDFRIGVDEKRKDLPLINAAIYFISVNEKATKKFMKKYPNAIDIKDIIKFETNYKGIGIDRQVVCSNISNGIVVDFGSAITVDLVKDSEHLGGFIMPGFSAYKRIYPEISKKLTFDFKNDINLDKIPQTTNDAINYAILNSIILPILDIYKKYKIALYFTGGDGELVLQYFEKIDVKYDKDMIFKSMKKIIKKEKGR